MYRAFRDRFCSLKAVAAPLAQISCAGAVAASLLAAAPVTAKDTPTTRLVACGDQSCLRIEGYREDAATLVAINGEPMAVAGEQKWSLTLPLGTLREIAEHGARRLEVTLLHPETRRESRDYVRLPIGLLGDTTELAAIQVTAS